MSPRAVTFAVWGALVAAMLSCEIAARVAPDRWPSVTMLLQHVEVRAAGRIAVVLFWMWIGWHTFAR